MPDAVFYAYSIYVLLLLLGLVASVWWRRRARRSVRPFDDATERVMRTAGEGARQKIDAINDELVGDAFGALLAPFGILLAFTVLVHVAHLPPDRFRLLVLLLPVLCLAALIVFLWRISRRILERSDWHLGQYGERNVADHLDPLRQRGWRIFHDVPAARKGKKFNIDPVAVGPGGVFAIETKTPRRPEMANGRSENHVVEYDGERLRWPTGKLDYDKPRRAQARAGYLRDWLREEKLPVATVHPILAIPWWYVRAAHTDYAVPAVNPKQLEAVILSRPGVLGRDEIELISARLENHCRDVAF